MYRFSEHSLNERETLHDKLKFIVDKAIKIVDFKIVEGSRSEEEQLHAYKLGVSKVKQGKHNTKPKSEAMDLEPYPVPKGGWREATEKDLRRFYFLAGVIFTIAHEYGIKIRWGGDWDGDYDYLDNKFDDLFHFELED